MIAFTIPIRTVSEANRASHEHWRVRHRRAKEQRDVAAIIATKACYPWSRRGNEVPAMTLRLVRGSPGKLDSDNLAGSMKHVRDGIADALGVDDGDDRFEWTYAQEQTKRGVYWVRVEIEAKAETERRTG